MGILDEDVARVREASDIVAVASQHLALKKVGRRFTGLCPFHAEKSPSFSVNAEEGLYYCLAGETRVLTWDGVRPISELAGGTHRILTEKGRWVDAPFYSFGVQPLMRVTLTRNRQKKELYATPEHRWLVRESRGRRFERTTAQLRKGAALAWSFPQNRLRRIGDLSPFGIAHGITFGDGSRFNNMASVDLHGEKDAQLLKWFPLNRTYQLTTPAGKPFVKVLDLPLFFKQPPALDEAPSYLAGWLAGYFAADGHVDKEATCSISSANRSHLELVRDVCTRVGVGTYEITEQVREGFAGRAPSSLYRIHFVTDDLDERFFLIDEHRFRFSGASKAWNRRGWVVQSVERTDRVEEVFCAVVDGTHNFTLEDNILTGNCFGCQAKGDVITLVRELEHVDFVGAVEHLANRAGIQLRYSDANESKERQRRGRLVDAMAKAVDWYHERLLTGADANRARGYLRSRGYDGEVVRRYKIGWAPDEWDALARALKLPDDVLRDTGLGFMNRRNRQQDAFRARILFPIFDAQGDPVAFGGRKLPDGEGPKYKNSPETPIYHKSKVLYGLNWAKTPIVEANQAVLCEGYTDVIGFGLAGVPRAVATCGTALTEDHIRTLKRFASKVVLAFDADAAGQAAADRIYEWEQKYEIDVAVAALPAGADPGDLARSDPPALAKAVDEARPFLAFRVDRVLAAGDLRSVEGRARAAEAALAVVREHPNELVRDQYLMEIADRCRIDVARLRERAGGARPMTSRQPVPTRRPPRSDGAEMEALRLAVNDPESVADHLDEVLFTDELHLRAFRALADTATVHEAIEAAGPEAGELLQRLAVEESDAEPADVIARLLEAAAARALADLEAEARTSDDPLAYAPVTGWLKLRMEELREPTTALGAADQLLPWLVEQAQEG